MACQRSKSQDVLIFCYLGDTLNGDGGVDLAATSIQNGWMKFIELLLFLTSRAPPPPAGDERLGVFKFCQKQHDLVVDVR